MATTEATEELNVSIEYNTDEELAAIPVFAGYPEGLTEFASVCCMLFILVGVPGNVATIVALMRCKKIRNATAIFIINLSFSDLLYCAFNFPLAATTFWTRSWPFGIVMCKLFPLMRYALSAVALCTILAITINRYILISHPHLYNRLYKNSTSLTLQIAATWIFAFSSLIPVWFEIWGRFGLNNISGICSLIPDKNNQSPEKLIFITAFFLPSIVITVGYIKIFLTVRKTMKRTRGTNTMKRKTMFDESSCETSKSPGDGVTSDNESDSTADRRSHPRFKDRWSNFLRKSGIFTNSEQKENVQCNPNVDANDRTSSLRTTTFRRQFTVQSVTSKDKRLVAMFSAIIIAFIICHLPLTVMQVLHSLRPHPVAFVVSSMLRYFTSCINPVLYVVLSKEYRKAYKKAFDCSKSCNTGLCCSP